VVFRAVDVAEAHRLLHEERAGLARAVPDAEEK
jgi:hypothetical protein